MVGRPRHLCADDPGICGSPGRPGLPCIYGYAIGERCSALLCLVSLWLGHASIQSTEIYLRADPTEKLEALAKMAPPTLQRGRFKAPDKLLAMLLEPSIVGMAVAAWTGRRGLAAANRWFSRSSPPELQPRLEQPREPDVDSYDAMERGEEEEEDQSPAAA